MLDLPITSGPIDLGYVRAALARAGRAEPEALVADIELDGGRTGAGVRRLVVRDATGEHSYVVKIVDEARWIDVALGEPARGEVALWQAGTTRQLPAGLACPTIDIAYDAGARRHLMLMDDVSAGIRPRGAFDAECTRTLLRALAPLHARYWDHPELAAVPLASLDGMTRILADAALFVARGAPTHAWIPRVLDGFALIPRFVPVFLDVLAPGDADFYLHLCADRKRWLAVLEQTPATVMHGDLRRANIGFVDGAVSLFDWELATRGPAAADLQWHWFLQFWAYPVQDGRSLAERRPLLDEYLDHLEAALSARVDRDAFFATFDAAFLRVLVQIGFCLVDPLIGNHGPDDITRVRAICREAVTAARRTYDAIA